MANTFAPNGFQQYQGTGSLPTYEQTQLAIASANTNPIFFGDPVVQAASATGVGTGYVTQGYGPVALTVGATGVATNAAGALTVTFSAATPSSGGAPLVRTLTASTRSLRLRRPPPSQPPPPL